MTQVMSHNSPLNSARVKNTIKTKNLKLGHPTHTIYSHIEEKFIKNRVFFLSFSGTYPNYAAYAKYPARNPDFQILNPETGPKPGNPGRVDPARKNPALCRALLNTAIFCGF